MLFQQSLPNRCSGTEIVSIGLEKEFSRLARFRDFPMSCPVFPIRLVQAGFTYENNGDEVTCTQCGLRYRNWKKSDNPFQIHADLSPGCGFIQENNQSKTNASGGPLDICPPNIYKELNHEQIQTPTPETAKTENTDAAEIFIQKNNQLATNAARGGPLDICQRISDKELYHKRIQTPTPETANKENADAVEINKTTPLGITNISPKYPQFSILNRRLTSYRNWPVGINQSPEQLARAGLFYEGKEDKVRCFHCAGGLSQWEPGDDPWFEHARWFPKCVFLRQCKGDEFVSDVMKGRITTQNIQDDRHFTSNSASTTRRMEPDHPAVLSVLELGYTRDVVIKALKHTNVKKCKTLSAELLLQRLFDIENSKLESNTLELSQEAKELSTGKSIETKSENANNSQELIKENSILKQQRTCKVCLDEESSIVFLPCGHLVACGFCASALRKCPICRRHINGTVRAILA